MIAVVMTNKEITRLKRLGKSDDQIYEIGVCRCALYGKAFFGFKSSMTEKQKMNRLWARILNNDSKRDNK
jgi:hypothetical protein